MAGKNPTDSLTDLRVYHSLDKGFKGTVLFDHRGAAHHLVRWFDEHRFHPEVVEFRLNFLTERMKLSCNRLEACIQQENIVEANLQIHELLELIRTFLLESWGHRDNSWAGLGTRFEKVAKEKGREHLAIRLNELGNLDDEQVVQRLENAPDWLKLRHHRSYHARQIIGEHVTKMQDARDVLRVFSRYELKKQTPPPFPAWLSVETNIHNLTHKTRNLKAIMDSIL